MTNGIYGVRFTSNGQDIGAGIVMIDGTCLHGGDSDYLYKGQFSLQENSRIEATVNVQNYSGRLSAVVGPFSSFELIVTGALDYKCIRLSGSVHGRDHRTIQIALTKISDLIDPSNSCLIAVGAMVADTSLGPLAWSPIPNRGNTTTKESTEVKLPRRRPRTR
ncbi:MAG: GrlR family regulatory protein [Nitrospira sp.]